VSHCNVKKQQEQENLNRIAKSDFKKSQNCKPETDNTKKINQEGTPPQVQAQGTKKGQTTTLGTQH
jgi:hypothetical protein